MLLLAGLQRIEDVRTAIEASPKAFGKGKIPILFSHFNFLIIKLSKESIVESRYPLVLFLYTRVGPLRTYVLLGGLGFVHSENSYNRKWRLHWGYYSLGFLSFSLNL